MSESGYIELPGGASAYGAHPPQTPTMGLVLLPSMPGTTPVFEEMAQRLAAEQGWAICVPEIITKDRNAAFAQRRLAVPDVVDDRVFSILREAAAETGCSSVSLMGFCVGGMYAMKAASLELFVHIVAFYGMVRLPEYWRSPTQGEPLDYLRGHTERLLAIFGEQDEYIPTPDIDAAEAIGVATVRYPQAGHAFAHDPSSDHFRPDDCADAWRRALDFIAPASASHSDG